MYEEEEKKITLGMLEKDYMEFETCDSDVFAEMRSNTLIMSGQHYKKVEKGLSRGLRDLGVTSSKRIRLVKNHTQKAINDMKDIIMSMVPGVMPYPAVEGEMRHQKAAEISRKVWNFGKEQNKWDDFREKSVDNFVDLGEAASKIYYNPLKGGLKGFNQKVEMMGDKVIPLFKTPEGEVTAEPVTSYPDGMVVENEPLADTKRPEFNGQVVIERIPAFDLLRDPASKDVNESDSLIYRKMIANEVLIALIKKTKNLSEEEIEQTIDKIKKGGGSTYRVFNAGNGTFEEKENHTLLKERYWRQCPKYPKGYFVIWTEHAILFEGEIPFGEHGDIAYPIKWQGHDRFESSARGFSPIKRVRPAQLEINRCASKITEHHLTVGDDKVILTKGAKFERGVDQPGIRVFYTTGTPQYFQGKSGEQFVGYLEHNIKEIYSLLNVPDNKNPTAQGFDPKAELFKSQQQKIKFSKPSGKLERYFKSVVDTYLFLDQKYATPEKFEKVVGSGESVNFEEYQQIDRLDFKVKLEEVSGDLETMLGKTMEIETILQYAGKDLDEQTRIAILSQYPILNKSQAFKHVTVHSKNIESDILQLERGQFVPPRRFDNHELTLQMLTDRMAQKDFGMLNPQIQKLFEEKYAAHEQVLKEQQELLREAQAGMIPTTGTLVRADVYVNDDPNNPQKTSRIELPADALTWLMEQLEKQGLAQERLQEIGDMRTQAEIMMGAGPGVMPPGMPQQQQPMIPTINQ